MPWPSRLMMFGWRTRSSAYRLVLKILDQRPLQVIVEIVLQEYIKGLDDNGAVRRAWRSQHVTRRKNLGVASAAELFSMSYRLSSRQLLSESSLIVKLNTIL